MTVYRSLNQWAPSRVLDFDKMLFLVCKILLQIKYHGWMIYQYYKFIIVIFILCVDSKFESTFKIDEARDVGSSKASSHKYLQVGLLADENVAAKHGNNTADFLLILANIVRNSLKINLMRMELVIITDYCSSST